MLTIDRDDFAAVVFPIESFVDHGFHASSIPQEQELVKYLSELLPTFAYILVDGSPNLWTIVFSGSGKNSIKSDFSVAVSRNARASNLTTSLGR